MSSKKRSVAWCVAMAALAASSLAAGAARGQEQEAPPAPVTVAPVVKGAAATTVEGEEQTFERVGQLMGGHIS